MPVHIGEISSEVTVAEGELPLSEAQLDKLVKLVMQRIEKQKREQKQIGSESDLPSSMIPKRPGSYEQ